ncbi:MAG: hypothetical protein CL933_23215 [Deltaproteobacteria bacterium]|nr:hypothetical protein [Deltaproteobacteria bacterium]
MKRNCPGTRGSIFRTFHRFVWVITAAWATISLVVGSAAADPLRIAVAPFAGGEHATRAAQAIVDELRRHPLDRLIAPGSFIAEAGLEPTAEKIRLWAYNASVETIVLGRILAMSPDPDDSKEEYRLEIVLRSGHSGAELARHETVVSDPGRLAGVGTRFANAILEDLGYTEPVNAGGDSGHPIHRVGSLSPDVSAAPGGQVGGGRGLDASLDRAGFDNDAPIEIEAEEAEIINRDDGRDLVFHRNVLVRQANVVLRTEYLRASYLKGESEPEKLDARGKVFVDQGGRRARCDRAVYLREAKQLTCTGHAELLQGCDTVRGESIQFDLGQDRARVQGAASIVILPEGDTPRACESAGGVL